MENKNNVLYVFYGCTLVEEKPLCFTADYFFRNGHLMGAVPPSVNLGPPYLGFCSLTTLHQIIFMFFIFAFLRHVCCQGHGSRSNVVVSYVKDSHYATALCGVV